MPVTGFGLCGPTYQTREGLWNNEKVFNWYPSIDESAHAKSKVILSPVPGLTTFTNLINPPVRGLWAGDNRLFAVGGGDLVEISSTGAVTVLGAVENVRSPVQFAANGESLLVASGVHIYLHNGLTLTHVADGISCAYLDGYYIILWPDANTIQISTDGFNWDELDIAEKIGSLDRVTHLESHEGHLWLFGRKTISPWYNSGNADFPFEPIQGAMVEAGTLAPWSPMEIDKKLYWLGSDKTGVGRVYRSDGYTPTRISNQAIEYAIAECLKLDPTDPAITGSGYNEDGHTFYQLAFPTAKRTLVYDLTTEMWHERARWTGTEWAQWRGASYHAYVFDKHLVARAVHPSFPDGDEKRIYEQNIRFPLDDGRSIRRYRAAPYVAADQQWLFHHYLRLYTNAGVSVSMRYLKDDGTSWSATKTGTAMDHEIKYRRLGRARDRLYEVWSINDAAPQSLIEAYLHASPGVQR